MSLFCLQAARPRAIVDLIRSAEDFRIDLGKEGNVPQPRKCDRCGYICSQAVCKACLLLEGLNKGLPSMGISRPRQVNNRAAAKSAAAAVRQQSGCNCQSGAVGGEAINGNESQHMHNCTRHEAASSEYCGNWECGVSQQRVVDIAVLPDTVDHLVHEDIDSQTVPANLAREDQQSQQVDGAEDIGSKEANAKAALSNCSGQQIAQLTQSQTSHVKALNIEYTQTNGSAEITGSSPDLVPLRLHGKQYESNLREVEAHPSARHRPLRADFDTSW